MYDYRPIRVYDCLIFDREIPGKYVSQTSPEEVYYSPPKRGRMCVYEDTLNQQLFRLFFLLFVQMPAYVRLRALVFVLLGLYGIIPIIHFLRATGFAEEAMIFVRYEVLMGLMYLAAALFFALQIPECLWPGAFDYWLHGYDSQFIIYIYR